MLRVRQVKLSITEPLAQLESKIIEKLRIKKKDLIRYTIYKESIDARKRPIQFSYVVDCEVRGEARILKRGHRDITKTPKPVSVQPVCGTVRLPHRPVVVGFGPSGMFAALLLAQMGYRPIVYERGGRVEERTEQVRRFWESGVLQPDNNVQFGEGGAGTFSDGKLTSRSKDPRCLHVLRELARFGAPPEIVYQAHPHIGTDILREVVRRIREEILALGGEIHFHARLEDIEVQADALQAVIVNGERVPCEQLLLCIGHSARDTMRMLYERQLKMEAKAFAVGLRIEHPQSFIDRALYGEYAGHPRLGAASYRMACRAQNGRGVYTFCMCPGGVVVPAASESGQVVVNGMSEHARDKENANSALLVQITPQDTGTHPLDGLRYQQRLEAAAYEMGGRNYQAPAQLVGDFLAHRPSQGAGRIRPSYALGVRYGDLHTFLPKEIASAIADGIHQFDRQMPGFAMDDAVLTAVETRSSSPLRMVRDQKLNASIKGIYPCGEGAGYAGGIITSAVDGIRCAQALIEQFAPLKE